MSPVDANTEPKLPGWLPGFAVLVAILLLLRGFRGTAEALWLQAETLASSFLMGPDGVRLVLWHTLPLAIAAAAIAFLVSGGHLKFDHFGSFVVVAGIVLGGAWLGGALRDEAIGVSTPVAPPTTAGLPLGTTAGVIDVRTPQPPEIDWTAAPDVSNLPTKIEPLGWMPKGGGVAGLVLSAIDQLLGYLAAYNPRLFVASLLAGGYLGWSWQRRLARVHQRITGPVAHQERIAA